MQGLIAGRTVQGLGGGCVMTIAYVLVPDLAPLHLRPRFQSGLTVIYGLASVVGTLIGKVIRIYFLTLFFYPLLLFLPDRFVLTFPIYIDIIIIRWCICTKINMALGLLA